MYWITIVVNLKTGEQLNPHGHGFIVEGGKVLQCARVRPGTNSDFFEQIWIFSNGKFHGQYEMSNVF